MLRRFTPLRPRNPYKPPRPADPWPRAERNYIHARDPFCVGRVVGFPTRCWGTRELDHVRASGGLGLKSESSRLNGVYLCSACHKFKTENGRLARPALLAYIEAVEGRTHA